MPETLTAPPPAPAKAPTPTAAPAPAPAPTPTPPAAAPEPESDAFVAELNKKFDDLGVPPAPDKEHPKPKDTPKPEVKAEPKQEQPKSQPKETEERPTPDGWKKLRADRERLKTELQAKESALADHEKKIQEWEAKGKDTEQLLGRLQTLEKERDEAKKAAQRARREVDDKFKETWEVPFNELAEDAAAVVNQLQVTFTDPQGIEQNRQANWEKDFGTIFAMDRGNASRTARAMFGEEAGLVMNYYDRLHENRRGRARALKKVEENWQAEEKREQEEAAQKAAQEEQNKSKWKDLVQKTMKEIGESVEDYHDPADADKTVAEARRKGYEIWDTEAKTLEGRLTKLAHARHRFAAYDPMKLTILRLQKQLQEANEKLEGFKNKTPNPKSPGGESGSGESKETWEQAARRELL